MQLKFSNGLLAGLLAMISLNLHAQTQTLENVLTATSRGTGPIISEGVNGYYSLTELNKKTKGKSDFQLSVFDQNLSPLSSKKFVMTTGTIAQEAAFNGEHLLFKFQNQKEKKYSYKMFDKNAKIVRSVSKPSYFMDYVAGADNTEATENLHLYPLPGKGFVNYSTKNQKGKMSKTRYVIDFFPSDSIATAWQANTPTTSDFFEYADYLGISGNTLLSLVIKRGGLFDKDLEEHILGTDLNTGKKLFEYKLEDPKHTVSTLNMVADETGNNFTIIGLYYEKDAKSFKDKSLGLFAFTLDANGKVSNRKYVSWAKGVAKFLPMTDKGKVKDVGFIFFHRFLKTSDGNYFGIGEEYHREASGLGIAGAVLSGGRGGTSVLKAVTGDLYVFEFDKDFDLKAVTAYDKAKSNVSLPPGASTLSVRTIGLYLKSYGGFDYLFTQLSRDKTEFSSGYLDYERTKGNKGWKFGSVNYSEGKLSSDKLALSSEATWFKVYPGKPGYVMVTEYFRKKKLMEFRMEKLNF
ncbi:MAG: DUF6770 family protein [Saprospiraceae bacterium]